MAFTIDVNGNWTQDTNPTPQLPGVAKSAIAAFTPVAWDNTNKQFFPALSDTAANATAVGIALNAAAQGASVKVAPFGSQLDKTKFVDAQGASLLAAVTTEAVYVGATGGTYGNIPAAGSNKYAYCCGRVYGNVFLVTQDKAIQIQ